MIGNDIVDLAQARQDSNWRRKGFLDKVFTPHEQQIIHNATDPDRMVWLLWSMKESTYKVAVRQSKNRIFAPTRIVCSIGKDNKSTAEGTVFYGDTYQTRSSITTQYIVTVAFAANSSPASAYSQVIMSFDTTSYQAHHELLLQKIKGHGSALFQTPEHKICIDKDSLGIPVLAIDNSATIPISFTHHGRYGAYVIGID